MRPVATAFLVIDMQNCFLTGSLSLKDAPARQDGLELIDPLNNFLDSSASAFDAVVYSLDWHPTNHVSFLSNAGSRDKTRHILFSVGS
jgi:nicotinamidase-related amidase